MSQNDTLTKHTYLLIIIIILNTLSHTNTYTYLPIANTFDATFNLRLILVITL